ncbi:MAG: VapE family protein [Peptostreptococcaceae bacterium]|nr:VapE family protein [Peptostreptococcaceae bacterium]
MEIKEAIQGIKTISDLKQVIQYYGINLEEKGKEIKGCCPFHSEKTPSFHITDKGNGAFYKCFGCGASGDIINFIQAKEGLTTLEAVKKAYDILGLKCDLEPSKLDKLKDYIEKNFKEYYKDKNYKYNDTYVYNDENNTPILVKIKYKHKETGKNQYSQANILDDGEYYKLGFEGNKPNILYNLPKVIKAINENNNIYFVEGEKDVETLKRYGLTATTLNVKKWLDKYTEQLTGAKIVFIGDTGKAGEEFKNLVYENLKNVVKTFKVVDLPNIEQLGDNADVTDWLNIKGNTKEKLIEAIKDSHDLLKDPIYKYLDKREDSKGNITYIPQKIWENLECLLKVNNIKVKYNELSKNIDIDGIEQGIGENSQLYDIHSLCHKNRLKLNINDIQNFIERISKKNRYNPVANYLETCFKNWDGKSRIKDLCNTLITPNWYNSEHKELFVTKWLINTARIPFNDGSYGCEGVLVLQGSQGVGKTRWIKSIVSNINWVKTGLEIDPSDKDKIKLATKYWISELGEMDATLKRDQAKLKAFFTEAKDEYRRAYARIEESYPRLTSFYATVNDEEFLKDPTGNRRYWVVPVEKINVDHDINLDQLWGEVMHLWKVKNIPYYLTENDYKILNENNKNFEVKDQVYIKIAEGFDWDLDKNYWFKMRSTEIANYLGITNMTALGNNLKKFPAEKLKRSSQGQFYIVPPFKKKNDEDLTSPFTKVNEKYNPFRAV